MNNRAIPVKLQSGHPHRPKPRERSLKPSTVRSLYWPGLAAARRASSPIASPTSSAPSGSTRAASWPSPSPTRPPGRWRSASTVWSAPRSKTLPWVLSTPFAPASCGRTASQSAWKRIRHLKRRRPDRPLKRSLQDLAHETQVFAPSRPPERISSAKSHCSAPRPPRQDYFDEVSRRVTSAISAFEFSNASILTTCCSRRSSSSGSSRRYGQVPSAHLHNQDRRVPGHHLCSTTG